MLGTILIVVVLLLLIGAFPEGGADGRLGIQLIRSLRVNRRFVESPAEMNLRHFLLRDREMEHQIRRKEARMQGTSSPELFSLSKWLS